MRLAIIGTGYVGLVTGTCFAEVGHDVFCVDLNEEKVKLLLNGVSPIFEPGLEAVIKRNIEHERLHFTTKLSEALKDVAAIFIAVGTPEGEDGSADLSYVLAAAREIGALAQGSAVVIVKSTVPVGTCDLVEAEIKKALAARGAKFALPVASNPEFLKEGTAVDDFMKPDRVVIGTNDAAVMKVFEEMYRPFVTDDPGKLFFMDRKSSELTKYSANAMLATRISFMNEISRLCDVVGANVDQIRRGMGADPRIGRKFLYAGPGYGGSCFPKDVEALLKTGEKHKIELAVLSAVTAANESQKKYVAEKILTHFKGNLKGKRVGVWGLAFKPGTDDVRESPSLTIIESLLAAGAEVVGHDPEGVPNFKKMIGNKPGLTYAEDSYNAVEGADAVVLVTEWREYKRPNWEKLGRIMRTRTVFDFRNQFSREDVEAKGFHYTCVGRPS